MAEFSDALSHITNRVKTAQTIDDPFQHYIIDEILPPHLFDLATQHWPSDSVMQSIEETGRAKGYTGRYVSDLGSESLGGMEHPQRAFWEELRGTLLAPELVKEVVSRFANVLVPIQQETSQSIRFSMRILVINDRSQFKIGPHTDIKSRAISLLFYMPEDDRNRTCGTSLYQPNDPTFRCKVGKHWPFDKFTRVKTVDFVPNRLFMFARTDNSFHGVEPLTELVDMRRLIVVDIGIADPN